MTPQVTKGHGTANDFVLVEDPHAQQAIPAETVRALTDRRRGIGADGLIRVVRSTALAEGDEHVAHADEAVAAGATWFMDYRNADGSIAQMCGNGVRVFAHYLVTRGLADLASPVLVGTRGGVKTVTLVPDPTGGSAPWYRVDMGVWRMPLQETDAGAAADAVVTTSDQDVARPAVSVDMGNPHTVVALSEGEKLDALDLHTAPVVDPAPADGTNVEFVVPLEHDDDAVGRIEMRVHERGVGETYSCGTGACAAAAATRFWGGPDSPDRWFVRVPGGVLSVTFVPAPDGTEHVVLAGPVRVVATAELV